jgi:high affinity Mn2+ porin
VFRAAGQVTAIGQELPRIRSPYANPDLSFGPGPAFGWSITTTLFAGVRPWQGGVIAGAGEYANGRGLPNPSGAAGYPNGEIIRVPSLGAAPYLARAFVYQEWGLGAAMVPDEPPDAPEARLVPGGPFGGPRPARRIEVAVGKFPLTDVDDVAAATTDPRHRFMNWALMDDGAWDYAADTRGYTYAALVALEDPQFAVRAALALMPTTANGPILDWRLGEAHSVVVEGEWRHRLLFARPGAVKLLGYLNQAHMGRYRDALAQAAANGGPPDVDAVRRIGAVKWGFGLLLDQEIPGGDAFFRAGWNDGATESFCFTEIDRTVSAGAEIAADFAGRPADRIGLAFAANGLSAAHAQYLAAGGHGFQLGDGRLSYAWEIVAEAYWTFAFGASYFFVTPDVQVIANPGMNSDRGPGFVFGLRLHAHAGVARQGRDPTPPPPAPPPGRPARGRRGRRAREGSARQHRRGARPRRTGGGGRDRRMQQRRRRRRPAGRGPRPGIRRQGRPCLPGAPGPRERRRERHRDRTRRGGAAHRDPRR